MASGVVGRNDPCPCGSGKKYKHCHLGREIVPPAGAAGRDPGELALAIRALPPCRHPRAGELAAGLGLVSRAGRRMSLRLVDLAAYRGLMAGAPAGAALPEGGVMINPYRTRVLDPGLVYLAFSPGADDSTIVHELAHAADYVEGSGLVPGRGRELAHETGIPAELLEHCQEFGERLLALAGELKVALDAEDEIVAFLAGRRLLIPGGLIVRGRREPLVEAAEKALRFMRENRAELDARIRRRPGYLGPGAA